MRQRQHNRSLALAIGFLMLSTSSARLEAEQITGSVQMETRLPQTALPCPGIAGEVRDAARNPLADVTVAAPDVGLVTRTGDDGRFCLPGGLPAPLILSFRKPGHAPATFGWDGTRSGGMLSVRLQKAAAAVVLDDELRHLGDGSFSPYSAAAGQFRRRADGVRLQRRFQLPAGAKTATLHIGAIIGLDTQIAHQRGESAARRVGSPLEVWLNGRPVAQIASNGDNHRISLPTEVLAPGSNNLEIRAGYQMPDGRYVDYDDMELMLLMLEFPAD